MAARAEQFELFHSPQPLPGGLVYVPDFLTAGEEASLLSEIAALPLQEARYKEFTAHRRTVSYGSEYDFGSNELHRAGALPEFLLPLQGRVGAWLEMPAEAFAQALVSEYRPGTALGWHRDVPDFAVVVGVSLAGPARMRFRPYPHVKGRRDAVFALELAPRSAYVLREEVRWRWQHSISATPGLRYSITFRTLVRPAVS